MAELAFGKFGSVLTQAQTKKEHIRNYLRLLTA
jgi:hypothetical protein